MSTPTDQRWVIVRVLRLIDDGPPVIIQELRFPDATRATDWVRSAMTTYEELGESSLAISITREDKP